MVAALFVETGGVYFGLDGVDPWDEARDARLYAGPWPVVAHPPCNRWSIMAQCRPGLRDGDDGGCFERALWAVREFGGVLEHPAYSLAWDRFALPRPGMGGWTRTFTDSGYTTEVDQGRYGAATRKLTWLYAVGCELPALRWGRWWQARDNGALARQRTEQPDTADTFAHLLLALARTATVATPDNGATPGNALALHPPAG